MISSFMVHILYLHPQLYPRSFLFYFDHGDRLGTTESAQEISNLIDLRKCRLYNIQKLLFTRACIIPTFSRKDKVKICAIFGKSPRNVWRNCSQQESKFFVCGAVSFLFYAVRSTNDDDDVVVDHNNSPRRSLQEDG